MTETVRTWITNKGAREQPPIKGTALRLLSHDWWKFVVLLVFVLMVVIAVARHEPFSDETQAWTIARDVSPFSILFDICRYETHPFLWYWLLAIPAKLGFPNCFLNIMSAAIGIFTVYLILWRSPFPVYVRLLLPFTYFFLFQHSVIARGYVLVAPLLFLIAMLYKKRLDHPYLFVILLCLLTHAELVGAFVAFGIFASHWIDLLRNWSSLEAANKKNLLGSSLIFVASAIFLVFYLWTPSDAGSKGEVVVSLRHFWSVFVNYYLDGCITNYWYVTMPILLISCAWFFKRKVLLLYLLPTALHFLLVAIKPASVFNQGIFLLEWLFALWVSFDGLEQWELGFTAKSVLRRLVIVCLLFVICVQIIWGMGSFFYDYSRSYCGTYEVAEFIKANDLDDAKIYMVGGQSPQGVNFYFDHNIFENLNNGRKDRSYWDWSPKNEAPLILNDSTMRKISNDRPDLVVTSVQAANYWNLDELNEALSDTDYEAVGPFPGHMIWKEHRYVEPAYSYYVLLNKSKFSIPD